MKLTQSELDWVDKRMDWYDIKFQEIYDELADHIISAIEVERENGDTRIIDIVFQQVTDRDFNGYLGIDEIVKTYEQAYRAKIKKGMWLNFKYYLNSKTAMVIFFFIIAGFFIPRTKATILIMLIGLVLTAIVPMVYARINSPKLKTGKGKQSIVKAYMITRSGYLLTLISLLLNVIGFIARQCNIAFLKPVNYHPVVYMLFFAFFITYGLSTIRLCKQEFKIAG
jgi:hypothetical protein